MMDNYAALKNLIEDVSLDLDKFYQQNNKAAGVRARKGLLELNKLSQAIRKDILQKRKSTFDLKEKNRMLQNDLRSEVFE